MHKEHYSDSYYVLARFLGRFARSIAAISFVCRVYVKLTIDPWIDHLQDQPMGRNPNLLVHILGALHPQSGVPIRQSLRKVTELARIQKRKSSYQLLYDRVIYVQVLVYNYPSCIPRIIASGLNVPWTFSSVRQSSILPECALNVPWMFPECSLNVPRMLPECSITRGEHGDPLLGYGVCYC
jgi:hypothetical protein